MADGERVICASAELAERGVGVRFEVPGPHGPQPAFAIRFEGEVRAFYNRCAHVPVELDWNDGRFFDAEQLFLICSIHGAIYDPRTGRCKGGPGRGGLTPLVVEERNGTIYLI